MDPVVLFAGITAAVILAISAKKDRVAGMDDDYVSLENIRKGISRGWYAATLLTTADGKRAVRLTGKRTDGSYSNDIYPVTEETYNALMADGLQVE